MTHRPFGNVRKRDSGRWEASYYMDGARHTASTTFSTKADARAFLAAVETDVRRGAWVDPRVGRITFGRYAELWLNARSDLRPRTIEQYNGLLKRYLLPAFGTVELAQLKPSTVRTWYGELAAIHPTSAVNSYRLLRAIYNTAVRDDVVGASPCRIIGGGSDRTPERPMPSVAQVEALGHAITERLRAAVVLAAWGGLRRGEVLGLQRHDVNELVGGVRIERTLHELHDGTVVYGPPKSAAGVRILYGLGGQDPNSGPSDDSPSAVCHPASTPWSRRTRATSLGLVTSSSPESMASNRRRSTAAASATT